MIDAYTLKYCQEIWKDIEKTLKRDLLTMLNRSTKSRSFIKKQLLALGYRTNPELVTQCIEYLKSGKSRHWIHSIEKFLNQKTVEKIARDYDAGLLAFLDGYFAHNLEQARQDTYRQTRYAVVVEAESMAPHRLWNLDHMKAIGIDDDDAGELLVEYDYIRFIRMGQEVASDSLDNQGEKTRPTEMWLKNFSLFPRYMRILYEMYYRTEWRDAPPHWVHRASYLRLLGQSKHDEHLIDAADDMMRYRVWDEVPLRRNLERYYQSLGRFKRTDRSRELFVETIRNYIRQADQETRKRIGSPTGAPQVQAPSGSAPIRKYGKR